MGIFSKHPSMYAEHCLNTEMDEPRVTPPIALLKSGLDAQAWWRLGRACLLLTPGLIKKLAKRWQSSGAEAGG